MKRSVFSALLLCSAAVILITGCEKSEAASDTKTVQHSTQDSDKQNLTLPSPDMSRPTTLMKALSERASVREFGDTQLSDRDLSDLLWAANGINRPQKGGRTAPSAIGAKDIDIYVIRENGIYLYDPSGHALQAVSGEDARALIGGQDYVKTAPVNLILVSEQTRFNRGDDAQKKTWAALDAGVVSQNISLFCAAAGLNTVPRAMIDKEKMRTALKLKSSQLIMLNHPVGYPQE